MTDFAAVIFNPVAQAKFVHTVSAGYVAGAMFVMSISAWYLLKGRHTDLAKRSMAVAASFGLASALSVVVLGDESGYLTTEQMCIRDSFTAGDGQGHVLHDGAAVVGLAQAGCAQAALLDAHRGGGHGSLH